MQKLIPVLIVIVLVVMTFGAACTGTEKTAEATPAPTPVQPVQTPEPTQAIPEQNELPPQLPSSVPSIWDQPVEQPPKDLGVSVSVEKDQIFYTIVAVFNGGAGQNLISDMQVRVITSAGDEMTKTLGKKKGDEVEFQGTSQTDRAEVAVWFMDGKSYKIYDELLGFSPVDQK